MNANLMVKLAVPVLLVLVLVVVIARWSGSDAPDVAVEEGPVGGEPLSPETAAAIGIEGDTPEDVVRTLIAEARRTNERLERMENVNEELRQENDQLREMRESIVQDLSEELGALGGTVRREAEAANRETEQRVSGLLERVEGLYRRGPSRDEGAPTMFGAGVEEDLMWLRPLERESAADGPLPWVDDSLGRAPLGREEEEETRPARPVYTVPKNSTLVGARAFTALVGRVPIGEAARVTDPYFFKLLFGRDNLAANGHEIPQIAYAVASGQAIGDWNLKCVAGEVNSMTFVFEDGRIVTIPEPADIAQGGSGTRAVRLGGLSDDYGNPCIAGERVTNAAAYLGQSMAVVAAGAAAEGAAAAQTTSVAGGASGGVATVVDGDFGRYAAGRGIAGAAEEVVRWLRERQAQEYDVVYVAPGSRVAVHVEEELRIDYDPEGRLVLHEEGYAGGYRALD